MTGPLLDLLENNKVTRMGKVKYKKKTTEKEPTHVGHKKEIQLYPVKPSKLKNSNDKLMPPKIGY